MDERSEERERQIIVGGFETDTDSEAVVNAIEDVLKVGRRCSKLTDVFTFTDPAKVGVIEFETVVAKKGFTARSRGRIDSSRTSARCGLSTTRVSSSVRWGRLLED